MLLADILNREHLSPTEVSRKIGRSPSYMSATISKGAMPRVMTLVQILDGMDYELVARSRTDGTEFVITEGPLVNDEGITRDAVKLALLTGNMNLAQQGDDVVCQYGDVTITLEQADLEAYAKRSINRIADQIAEKINE